MEYGLPRKFNEEFLPPRQRSMSGLARPCAACYFLSLGNKNSMLAISGSHEHAFTSSDTPKMHKNSMSGFG